jgi:hypothetical protein
VHLGRDGLDVLGLDVVALDVVALDVFALDVVALDVIASGTKLAPMAWSKVLSAAVYLTLIT